MWFKIVKIAKCGTFTKVDMYINEVVSEEYTEVSHAALMLALLSYACSTVQC